MGIWHETIRQLTIGFLVLVVAAMVIFASVKGWQEYQRASDETRRHALDLEQAYKCEVANRGMPSTNPALDKEQLDLCDTINESLKRYEYNRSQKMQMWTTPKGEN